MKYYHVGLAVLGCVASLTPGWGQSEKEAETKNQTEQRWTELQDSRRLAPGINHYAGLSGEERKALMLEETKNFRDRADSLKQFYTDFPDALQASEAKLWEVQNLLWAAQAGDRSQDERWLILAADVRKDTALRAEERFAVAAQADFYAVTRDPSLSSLGRQNAMIKVSRGLIAEFPSEPGGYESLLALARNSRDMAEARSLAEEVAALPAPNAIKRQARLLAERFALVGQQIGPILKETGYANMVEEGRGLIIYAWATWNDSSVILAEQLGKLASEVQMLGLCLDADLIPARDLAEARGLPGRQIYDARAQAGALAQALRLNDAGWIYLVDRTGVIISVRGQDDPIAWQTL